MKVEFRLEHFIDLIAYGGFHVFMLEGNVVTRWLLVMLILSRPVNLNSCAEVCVVCTAVAFRVMDTHC
jgi:hypothetical protein